MKLPGVFLEENSGESPRSFVCVSVVNVRDVRARFSCSKATLAVVGRVTGGRSKKRGTFRLCTVHKTGFPFLTGDSEQDGAVSRERWRVAFHEMDSGTVYVQVKKFQSNISEINFSVAVGGVVALSPQRICSDSSRLPHFINCVPFSSLYTESSKRLGTTINIKHKRARTHTRVVCVYYRSVSFTDASNLTDLEWSTAAAA